MWEVDSQHQLGDQFHPPAGAAVPGGDGFTYTDENLRRAVVIGEQAARAALDMIDGGEWIGRPTISYRSQDFYSRLSHFGFRVLLVVDPATGFTQLGHLPPTAYTCPATGRPPADARPLRVHDRARQRRPLLPIPDQQLAGGVRG